MTSPHLGLAFGRALCDEGFLRYLVDLGYNHGMTVVVAKENTPWEHAELFASDYPMLLARPLATAPYGWEVRVVGSEK